MKSGWQVFLNCLQRSVKQAKGDLNEIGLWLCLGVLPSTVPFESPTGGQLCTCSLNSCIPLTLHYGMKVRLRVRMYPIPAERHSTVSVAVQDQTTQRLSVVGL